MILKFLHLFAIFLSVGGVIGLYRTIGMVKEEYRLSYVLLSVGILATVAIYTGVDYWMEYLNPGPGLEETLHFASVKP